MIIIFSRVIVTEPCKSSTKMWSTGCLLLIKWSTGRLLLMFVLFTLLSSAQALRVVKDMNWTENPAKAWPYSDHHYENFVLMLLLNERNYSGDNKEWKFIAPGVLLDNSRILTSYNPFRKIISDPKLTDKIVALLPTGMENKLPLLKIANIVCGRQIAYVPDEEKYTNFWSDNEHYPLHDLMVIRIEEEVGVRHSYINVPIPALGYGFHEKGQWYWSGNIKGNGFNCLISYPARLGDEIDPEVLIFTLGYLTKKQMRDFDTIHEIAYEADDAAVVDCDEWLPRQWGFFICIRNIGNFPGLGSGATLFSKHKLFGIGSFAMFKNDVGIFVFTDVRPYEELIEKTCGDEEFT